MYAFLCATYISLSYLFTYTPTYKVLKAILKIAITILEVLLIGSTQAPLMEEQSLSGMKGETLKV